MNNKNQRIAYAIGRMSIMVAGISNQLDEIRKIILEPESVTAKTVAQTEWNPVQSKPQTAGIPKRAEFVSDNRKTVDWKDQMTEEINDNNRKVVQKLTKPENVITVPKPVCEKVWQPNARTIYATIHGETDYLKIIHKNYRTTYYKITSGPDKGAVLSVDNKSKTVIEDGRYDGRYKSNNATRLAVVSVDQDGKDYVNRVIREKRGILGGKLVRMYRPNPPNWNAINKVRKPITHCAIYEQRG